MPTWDPGSPLRSWLRKAPKPSKVRVRTEDGEERMLQIPPDVRTRWKALEEAVIACRAISIECLDAADGILRAKQIELDDQETEPTSYSDQRKAEDRSVMKERQQLAGLLDAYGHQLNTAFDKGAAAANTGQQQLVNLVGTLTEHLTLAITNVHNLSINLANYIAQNTDDSSKSTTNPSDEALQHMLGALAARAMTAGQPPPASPPSPPVPPNGKGKTR